MLRHYASETTIHGVKDLHFSKSYIIKVVWAILLITAFVGLGSQIENIVDEYLQEPTSSVNTIIKFKGMVDILYCPRYWINATKASELGFTAEDFKYFASLSNMLHVFGPKLGDELYGTELHYRGYFLAHSLHNESYVHDLQASFLQKAGNFTTFDALVRFLAVDWNATMQHEVMVGNYTPIVTTFGACAKFEYNQNVDDLMMDFLNYSFTFQNPDPYDISVRDTDVLAFGDDVHTMRTGQFLTLSPNNAYEIDLIISKTKRVSTRHVKCTEYAPQDYGACFENCRAKIIETSSCRLIRTFNTGFNLSTACTSMLPLGKFGPPTVKIYNDNIRPVFAGCISGCHQPCDRWTNRVTYINIGPRNGIPSDNGSINYFEFYVINSFDIHYVEEFRIYSAITLFSNLGGMISLFCGASLLSAAQLLMCLAEYLGKFTLGRIANSDDVEIAEVSAKKEEISAA